jgi:predicted lipid-binding transport protein (Tim44 family)
MGFEKDYIVVETFIFAGIAAFLAFKLYTVLGKRTGHEQTIINPLDERKVIDPVQSGADETRETTAQPKTVADPFDKEVSSGLRSISSADSRFDTSEFIEGARAAYRFILEAFWSGDKDALAKYTSADVREAFDNAIDARLAAGEVLDNRLVAIERSFIIEASLANKIATIKVQFDADIASVTRDAQGNVVAGSLSDALQTHDVWTFERDLKSGDPNWTLIDTDDVE